MPDEMQGNNICNGYAKLLFFLKVYYARKLR